MYITHKITNTDSCALLGCTPIKFVSRYISLHHWSTLLPYKTSNHTVTNQAQCRNEPPMYAEQAHLVEVPKPVAICILALTCFLRHNAVFLRKLPVLKSSQCSAEPIGVAYWLYRCTCKPSTVTLAVHARRGLIMGRLDKNPGTLYDKLSLPARKPMACGFHLSHTLLFSNFGISDTS